MTIFEQIKAEIERRIKIQDDWAGRKVLPGRDLAFAVKEELKQLLSFLDTLEMETKEEKKVPTRIYLGSRYEFIRKDILLNEIERLKNNNEVSDDKEYASYELDVACGYDMACNDILSFLSTLESEKPIPNDLEEASSKFATHTASNGVSVEFLEEKLSFQEGAKWQKEQDEILKVNYEGARTVYDNTVQHLQEKIDEKYELGKKDMKEQMLKGAVEGVLVDNVDGTQEICLHGNRYGEKVRIIIVKEDEK